MRLSAAFLADAGRAAYRVWLPLVAGIAVVSSVLFAPNGMTAHDAVEALGIDRALLLGLFAAWVLAASPAARRLFGTPATLYLRSLARGRAFAPAIGAALIVAELPWTILFAKGAGPVAAAAALASAAAAHAALAGRRLLLAALVGAAVVLVDGAALAAAGLVCLIAAAPAAWRAAAEARKPGLPLVGGGPIRALASAHLAGAIRGAPSAVIRAAIVVGAGGALAGLVGRNNQLAGRPLVVLAFGMGVPILVVALGGLRAALRTAEEQAGWLLASLGVSAEQRFVARWAAIGALWLLAGAVYAAIVVGG